MSGQSAQPHFASASLYVGDISSEVTEATLYEIFHAVGPVSSIRVCRDSLTRKSLGYAYVNYHSPGDAERALDTLNFSSIRGTPCRIMWSHRDPALRKTNIGNVFVKNIDKTVDTKALYDTFSIFGNILSCKVATGNDGKSLGYGFIHFESDEAAKIAIGKVDGMQIGNKQVYVGPFVRKQERGDKNQRFTNVYFKNFPKEWEERTTKDYFEKIGPVSSLLIKLDQRGRPFGFANFVNSEDAATAIADLNDQFVGIHGLVEKEEDAMKIPPELRESDPGEDEEDLNVPLRFYVGRAMTKSERAMLLKKQTVFSSNSERANPQVQGAGKEEGRERTSGVNLYVKNLADEVDDIALRLAFEEFGKVVSAKVMRDQKTQSRGFGFVSFENPESAPKAVTEMHLKMFFNKPLYVGLAEKREQRFARLQQRYRIPPVRSTAFPGMGTSHIPFPSPLLYQSTALPLQPPQSRYVNYPQPSGGMAWRGQAPGSGRPPFPPQQQPGGQVHLFPARMSGPGHMQAPPRSRPQRGAYKYGELPKEPTTELQWDHETPVQQANPGGNGETKQGLGEKLFPQIQRFQPQLAGKITGMMLEMDDMELNSLLDSETLLKAKVDEAMRVLEVANHGPPRAA